MYSWLLALLGVCAAIFGFALPSGPAAGQPVDPRCASRTGTGQFTCVIDKPNVRQRETLYPNVVFAPGDVVRVSAAGCVQTGGFGNTWKRYVNPSGSNSDHLYHGLIRIPGATAGEALVRIKDVIGSALTVRSGNLPLSEYVLHLGYEDDDYGDNGYNNHDNGTDNQCRNVGAARVSITVVRSGQPPPPAAGDDRDFNLEWAATAPGGLPLNPRWTWQRKHPGQVPSTSLCHNFSKAVQQRLPNGTIVTVKVPDFADCTNQTDLSHVDTPDGVNSAICGFGDTDSFHGHVNWFAVTIAGTVAWDEHSTDDDYNLAVRGPDNGGLLNTSNNFHSEFDSDETIDHFKTQWWREFHDLVDASDDAEARLAQCEAQPTSCTQDDIARLQRTRSAPKTLLNGSNAAVVTGLFGLDCEHNCKVELHPVYALAARVRDMDADEMWAIFVRNVGDEGFCSRNLWEAPFTTYTFRLPWRAGMQSVQIVWGAGKSEFEGTPGTSGPDVTFVPPAEGGPGRSGVYVTFHLPPPAQSPLIDGVLHLSWTRPRTSPGAIPPPGRPPAPDVVAAPPEPRVVVSDQDEAGEAEGRIAAAATAAGIPPSERTALRRRTPAAARTMTLSPLPQGAAARQVPAASIATRAAPVLLGRKGAPAAEKLARDKAMIGGICARTANAPPGLPAEACTPGSPGPSR